MRILYDVRPLQTASRLRGIGIVTRKLLEAFARLERPHEVGLLCWPGERPHLELPASFCATWVEVAPPPVRRLGWMLDAWTLRQLARAFDRCLFLSPFDLQIGWPWAPRNQGSSLVFVHDLIPVLHSATIYTGHQRLLVPVFWLQAWRLRSAQKLVCNSETTARLVRHHLGLTDRNVEVAPLGVDPDFFPPGADEVQSLLRQQGLDLPYVLYVGGPNPNKNLDRLFAALRRIPNAPELVCVTRGLEAQRLHGLRSRVLEEVNPKQLRLLYGGASLVVQPSLFEGFGLPVLEAMACGAPIACSRISPHLEVAAGVARYFDPHDPDDISRTIREALADRSWVDAARRAGLERAATFTWEACARRVCLALEQPR